MANWICNIVECENQDVIDFMMGSEGEVDFGKVIPMPEELQPENDPVFGDGYSWGLDENALKAYEQGRKGDELYETGKILAERLGKYGATNWYNWSNENWGVKWNASSTDETAGGVSFQTPWADVPGVVAELSKRFPDEEITYKRAQTDDFGGFAVVSVFTGGEEEITDDPDPFTEESFILSEEITGDDLEFLYECCLEDWSEEERADNEYFRTIESIVKGRGGQA